MKYEQMNNINIIVCSYVTFCLKYLLHNIYRVHKLQ